MKVQISTGNDFRAWIERDKYIKRVDENAFFWKFNALESSLSVEKEKFSIGVFDNTAGSRPFP